MRGDIPPLPQYAFTSWCSIEKKKHRGNFTVTFLYNVKQLCGRVKSVFNLLFDNDGKFGLEIMRCVCVRARVDGNFNAVRIYSGGHYLQKYTT
jgi:hypothetical protein